MKITIKDRMQDIAIKYGIGFKDRGEKVEFYIHFNPDAFIWHTSALLVWWEQNSEGLLNWWTDEWFDGRHCIVGPGYPAYAIHNQEPIEEEALLEKIDKEIAGMAKYYKQFNYHV